MHSHAHRVRCVATVAAQPFLLTPFARYHPSGCARCPGVLARAPLRCTSAWLLRLAAPPTSVGSEGKGRGDVLRGSIVSVQFSRPTCSARPSFLVEWGWQSFAQCTRLQTFGSRCPSTVVAERLLQFTSLASGPGAARHFGLHFIGLRARRGAPHCYGLAGSTVAARRLI